MRQLADQHLPIQPRALPRLIQQPRLVLFYLRSYTPPEGVPDIAPVSACPSSGQNWPCGTRAFGHILKWPNR